jgi:hypothetical protein
MKNKTILVLLAVFLFGTPVLGQNTGYVSSNFLKSQKDGEYFKGTFTNPLFGLIFSGDISTGFAYGAEFRIADITHVEIDQAWVGLHPSEAFRLQGGLYLVPFGIYNRINRPHQTTLISTPLHVEYCYPERWRDIGIVIDGIIGGFVYQGYLGNGLQEGESLRDGQQFEDNNKDKGKGGRIGWRFSREFELAYSINTGKYDNEDSFSLTLHGVDVNWTTEDWQILGEYTKAIIKNPEGYSDGEAEAYFVQVAVYMGVFQPYASYQKLKYVDPYHGPGFSSEVSPGGGISLDRSRWALGVVYIPVPYISIKFEYDFNREKIINKKDDLWAIQAAVSF